jgi:hypothetical protein
MTMRSLLKIGLGLTILAAILIGLGAAMLRSGSSYKRSAVHQTGRIIESDARTVTKTVNTIELAGPIDLEVRQGTHPSLVVQGERRLLPNIETSQEGSLLHIGTKGMLLHHKQRIKVELVLPTLESVDIRSNADTHISGFAGDRLELSLNGAGRVVFNGRYKEIHAVVHGAGRMSVNGGNANQVHADLNGTGQMTFVGSTKELFISQVGPGEITAQDLAADKLDIDLKGPGTINVYARKEANVRLDGNGEITVYGNPDQRSISRSGAGEVNFLSK